MANISVPLLYNIFNEASPPTARIMAASFVVLKRGKEPRIRYALKACAHHLLYSTHPFSLSPSLHRSRHGPSSSMWQRVYRASA